MRFYRALLHFYPASFRGEYGEEMAGIVRLRLRDADGPFARLALWTSVAWETIMNALAVHWDILRQDLRYTARALSRARGFALTAILIVGLGVGANTAAFSLADFVLLRPLPFPAGDRLVTVWERTAGYGRLELSPSNYRDWKAAATSFEQIGAYTNVSANLVGNGEPERLVGAQVTGDLFPTLGVNAALGRTYTRADDFRVLERGADSEDAVLVISDRLWRAAFGADSGIIGRKVILNDRPFTVIGVMPPSFSFPTKRTEFWSPYSVDPGDFADRSNNYLYGIGRLKPGVTLASVRTEMSVIAARSRQQYPKENEGVDITVNAFRDELSLQARNMVLALSGAALCVLLIVCANLANLLLARALGRRQELAVRTAMGAGRERLIRQLATESLVLATLGGALGVLFAVLVLPLLWRLVPANLPTSATPGLDLRVLAFAAVLTVVTALAFGLAPMARTGADADARGLREGARAIGGRKEKLRGALVIVEVVASVVLLIATGLLVRALWTIQARDPGFRADSVLTLRTTLPMPRYGLMAVRGAFYRRVLDDVRAVPGVSSAAYISFLPMVMRGGIWGVGLPGKPNERRDQETASLRFVTPGFFSTLKIPLRIGRDVSESDTGKTQMVAVVSESFVKQYFPEGDPLAHTFNFANADRTIVGVVADIRVRGLERSSEPQVYLPYQQQPDNAVIGYTPKDLVVSASTPLDQLVPAVRGIIRRADPMQPIADVRPMTDILDAETASRTVQVRVLAGFALVAFLLAAIGIHGVLSFAVSQRTAEIGVRIALGAQRQDILGMVLKQGVILVAAGLVPGLVLAYFAGRMLQSTLLGSITPADLPTFTSVVGLTLLMAFGGTLLPTLRALRVDPIKAIRTE
jgi:predicted permease